MLHNYFAQPQFLWALAILPLLAIPAAWAAYRRRQTLSALGSDHALTVLLTVSPRARRWRGLLISLGLTLLIIAAAGPQWGRDWFHETESGRDVVVLLDCSRSMRAGTPSRLTLARSAALDLADTLQQHGGYRIALVICASNPRLVVPLTHDFAHFRSALDAIDYFPDDPAVRPQEGDTSGTRLGRGLLAAIDAHDERNLNARDIVLLSDGDDPVADAEWQTGCARARAAGIPVTVVGVGNPDEDVTIPGPNGPIRDKQGPVKSHLEEAPLREIARQTEGEYIPGRTDLVPLGRLYLDHAARRPVRQSDPDALPVVAHRQMWFLAPAFALLAVTLFIPDRRRRVRPMEYRT